jgi:hypothetical protein
MRRGCPATEMQRALREHPEFGRMLVPGTGAIDGGGNQAVIAIMDAKLRKFWGGRNAIESARSFRMSLNKVLESYPGKPVMGGPSLSELIAAKLPGARDELVALLRHYPTFGAVLVPGSKPRIVPGTATAAGHLEVTASRSRLQRLNEGESLVHYATRLNAFFGSYPRATWVAVKAVA